NVSAGYTSGGTQPYTYNWTDAFANSYPATNVFTQTVTQNNTFTYDIVDANGCTAGPYSFNMTVTPPLQLTVSSQPSSGFICPGDAITLNAVGSGGQLIDFGDTLDYAYSWNTGNPDDTLNTLTITPTADTTQYVMTLTDYCNAVLSETLTVIMYPNPVPVISPMDTIACSPYISELVNINDVGGTTTWQFSNGVTHIGQTANKLIFTEPTCYDVEVSTVSADGCTGSAFFTDIICINPLPNANFTFEPEAPRISDGYINFNNLSSGAENFYWDFGRNGRHGRSNDSLPTFAIPFDGETSFTVCLTAETNFGCLDTFCQIITVQDDIIFYVPNTFTPDAGNLNSFFKPVFTSGFDRYKYELLIFNRWGEIVFQSRDPEEGWDGRYGEKQADQAAYVWKITYEDTYEDVEKTVTGHVTLLR
ncbi:MAG: gliding motility-associated C-terminal domain-containing protein, partial [Putridiphycobacter sp.]|nr:gliding motility-associated C-terminal domain-containing protein [Putridiphycobacter sp.]